MLKNEKENFDSTQPQGIIYIKENEVNVSGLDSYDRKGLIELNNGLHLDNVIHEFIPNDLEIKNEIIVKSENIDLLHSGVWISGHPALNAKAEKELFFWSSKRKFHDDENNVDTSMKYYQKCGDYFPLGDGDEDDFEAEDIEIEAVKVYVLSEGLTLKLTEKDLEPFKELSDEEFIRIVTFRTNDGEVGDCIEEIFEETANRASSEITSFIFDENEYESKKNNIIENEDENPEVFKSIFYLKMKDIRNSPSKGKNILIPIYAYNMIDYGYHY